MKKNMKKNQEKKPETGMRKKLIYSKIIFFIVLLIIIFFLFAKTTNRLSDADNSAQVQPEVKKVRNSVYAGSWYPGSESVLSSNVEKYLSDAGKLEHEDTGNVRALIVPHAGYVYSAQVAAQGFKQLEDRYNKVIIIATNHAQNANFNGISVSDATHYSTPLGEVKVSSITKELLKHDLFTYNEAAHSTHVIEIELPFLQKTLSDFEIVPLVTSGLTYEQVIEAAEILSGSLDDKTLIVVSTDLSHYHPYEDAKKLDTTCINAVESMDRENAYKCEACGIYAIAILMEIAGQKNWQPKIADYKNSGDTAGDKERVVGYSSIVFYGQETTSEQNNGQLTEAEKQTLLRLARDKLESLFYDMSVDIDSYDITPNLKKKQGCFTTLNKNGNLRGCIGHILPQEELYKCVMENAENAAFNDPRFNKVTEDELRDIEIEVSVLTVPQRLEFSSGEDLKSKLRQNVDGVVMKKGWSQSTYLPQVWEQLPSHDMFLSQLCIKGNMKPGCWQDTSTEVYTYQAIVFHESYEP